MSHIWTRDRLFATSHTRRSPSLPGLASPPLRRLRATLQPLVPCPLPEESRPRGCLPHPACTPGLRPAAERARRGRHRARAGLTSLTRSRRAGLVASLSSSLKGLAANTTPAHRDGHTSLGPTRSVRATVYQRHRRLQGLPHPPPASSSSCLSFLSPPPTLEEARAPFPNRCSSLAAFPAARTGGKVGARGFTDRFT